MFQTGIKPNVNGPIKPKPIFLKRKHCDGALETLCVSPHMSASESILALRVIYNSLEDLHCKIMLHYQPSRVYKRDSTSLNVHFRSPNFLSQLSVGILMCQQAPFFLTTRLVLLHAGAP